MDNKFDDFFDKKLNDFDSPSDGWDEPSEAVWNNAQQHFPTYNGKSRWNWLAILALLLGVGLTGAGVYIFKMKQEQKQLKTEIASLNTTLNQEKSSVNTLQNENISFQNQLATEREQSVTIIKNLKQSCAISLEKAIENEAKQYQQKIQEQKQQILGLRFENQQLKQEKVTTKIKTPIAKSPIDKMDNELNSITTIENKSFSVATQNTKSLTFPKIPSLTQKTWKKFEAGIELSTVSFNIELSNNFENISSQQTERSYYVADATGTGFYIAYAPLENFYLTSGLRYANFFVDNTYISSIIYNQSNEYTNDQGEVFNDIHLSSSNTYNSVEQEITVEIPNGVSLETGDILLSTMTNYQDFQSLQIPFGIMYFRGKRRLQLQLQGGFTWNYVIFGDYDLNANFQANNMDIPVDGFSITENATSSKSYLGAYLGIGANYRFTDKWHLRAGLKFEESGLSVSQNGLLRNYLIDSGAYLGLNYRF